MAADPPADLAKLPVSGQVFVLHIIAGEKPPQQVGK